MALQRDLTDHLNVVRLLAPATYTAAAEQTTAAIDTDFMRDGILVIDCGAIAATSELGYQLQTCDTDDGTYADVLSADGAITTADTLTVVAVAVKDLKRYVKFQYDVDTDDALFGAVLIGSRRPENPPN